VDDQVEQLLQLGLELHPLGPSLSRGSHHGLLSSKNKRPDEAPNTNGMPKRLGGK
jgi:hypothetical protein